MLADVATESNSQVWVVSIIKRPLPDSGGHIVIVVAVQLVCRGSAVSARGFVTHHSHVVGRIEEHGCGSDAGRYRRTEHSSPVSAAHPHAA